MNGPAFVFNPHEVADALGRIDADRAAAEYELDLAIATARMSGCSWAAIGEALGITRQAAQQRFKKRYVLEDAPEDAPAFQLGPDEYDRMRKRLRIKRRRVTFEVVQYGGFVLSRHRKEATAERALQDARKAHGMAVYLREIDNVG